MSTNLFTVSIIKKITLDRVNELCNLLQRFLSSHSGFMRDELQGYLNLFSIIVNPPANK